MRGAIKALLDSIKALLRHSIWALLRHRGAIKALLDSIKALLRHLRYLDKDKCEALSDHLIVLAGLLDWLRAVPQVLSLLALLARNWYSCTNVLTLQATGSCGFWLLLRLC